MSPSVICKPFHLASTCFLCAFLRILTILQVVLNPKHRIVAHHTILRRLKILFWDSHTFPKFILGEVYIRSTSLVFKTDLPLPFFKIVLEKSSLGFINSALGIWDTIALEVTAWQYKFSSPGSVTALVVVMTIWCWIKKTPRESFASWRPF